MGETDVKTKTIKLVVVGDGSVGKTSLLLTYARSEFPHNYEPTVFDCITTTIERENTTIKFNLWDTAGQEDYDRLRHLAYHQADVFLLCYAIDSSASLHNAKEKWAPELIKYSSAPFLLIGLKSDQQHVPKSISKREGCSVSRSIKSVKHLECSALKNEGVDVVFDSAIDAVLLPRVKKCNII